MLVLERLRFTSHGVASFVTKGLRFELQNVNHIEWLFWISLH